MTAPPDPALTDRAAHRVGETQKAIRTQLRKIEGDIGEYPHEKLAADLENGGQTFALSTDVFDGAKIIEVTTTVKIRTRRMDQL